jgi:hypothetical protein
MEKTYTVPSATHANKTDRITIKHDGLEWSNDYNDVKCMDGLIQHIDETYPTFFEGA